MLLDRHRERLDERIRVPELGGYAQQTAKRLKAVYVLQPSRFTEAQFVELAPVQSLQALAAATYFASPHAKVEWWGKLDDMNSVVEAVPFHAVQYRRTASGLPALLSRIIEHASGVTQRSI